MVSHDLLKRFSAGFQRFQKTWYCPENNIYEDLRVGQHPYALVIACSDSRVDPVLLLDATPGDLFVIRNVANLVPPYEPDSHHHGVSAALEYAVRHLHIGHIMVMGHAKCGGFTSLLEASHSDDEFLNIWMNLACRAKAEVDSSLPGADPDERQRACEMWGVRFSLDNLMGYPWIKSAVDGGELLLHGLYFDMGSGELLYFDAESETYVPMGNRGRMMGPSRMRSPLLFQTCQRNPSSPTEGFCPYRIPVPGSGERRNPSPRSCEARGVVPRYARRAR